MMNQFIIPFRKISPKKILQILLKNIARRERRYTTKRNANSKRVHWAANRCADRSGNISAAS